MTDFFLLLVLEEFHCEIRLHECCFALYIYVWRRIAYVRFARVRRKYSRKILAVQLQGNR